ncbi:MAG: cation:proton antiporter [Bacillota bacterium]|nr:cation:proton antiporter [Bacillota bacterium]
MSQLLICISFALIMGLLFSRLAKKTGLPAVTAYLIAGLFIGPFCLGKLGIGGIGFNSLEQVEGFKIISQVALGFIAFAIGNEFRMHDLKSMGKQAIVIGILQAVITTAIVDVALIGLHFMMPNVISLPAAIVLGAIAAATAPAATLMVVRQYKAEGPLTKLLLMVVAIDDAVGLILFALSFGIAGALESGAISVTSVLVEPILEIVLSAVLGVICGIALDRLEVHFASRSKRMSLAVGFVLLAAGLSLTEFHIGGIHCSFSILLVCMITGTVFCNICDASEELMDRVDRWTSPINVLFFVLSGAELDLGILSNPMVLLIGIVYIVFRSSGKIFGSYISCKMTSCSQAIQKYLGITLLPQAGVALGMAITAASLADGKIIRNVVLFSVMIYELVGPTLTKRSLIAAGEINLEGKSNAREINNKEVKVHNIKK